MAFREHIVPATLAGVIVIGVAACAGFLASQPGQLFCAVQTAGGGALVVGLIDAEATSAAPAAAPVAILATGLAKAQVDADCAKAAPGGGVAVSPPANPTAVPQVAVVPAKT